MKNKVLCFGLALLALFYAGQAAAIYWKQPYSGGAHFGSTGEVLSWHQANQCTTGTSTLAGNVDAVTFAVQCSYPPMSHTVRRYCDNGTSPSNIEDCSEYEPPGQCDSPAGTGTGYSTTGYYSMNGVVCGADYCEYNAQGGGYESSTNTSYAIAHSTGSTCPNPGEGTEGWEEYDPFTPDPPEEEIPEGCYKVHGEVMCPLEPVDNGDECGEVNGYEVCVQENGCTLVEGHEVCPDTPLNCVEGGGRRICIEGEPEEGPEPEGPADNCIVGSDGRVLCWSDESEETTETTTEEVDNGDGTSTTTTTSTTTNNNYGGGSKTTVTVDDGNGGITSTTTTQGTGEETFDGPDPGGVQSFEESALAFYSDVSGGPWGSAITDLGANFPEGGSCNTLDMSLYFGDISTDVHCVVWDTVKGGLEYGMIALWSILAILIVFSA